MSVLSSTRAKNIVIIGRRGYGKTYLITEILKYQQTPPENMTIACCTNDERVHYSEIYKDAVLHDEYKHAIVIDVFRKSKESMSRSSDSLNKTNHTIVFDNCMYDNSWIHNKYIQMLFTNGKIWRIHTIISLSYPIHMPPVLQVNVDYVFIFNDTDVHYLTNIWKNYVQRMGGVLSLENYHIIMAQLTKPYECLVVKRADSESYDLQDYIFVILMS
jgi:hypothetical protein